MHLARPHFFISAGKHTFPTLSLCVLTITHIAMPGYFGTDGNTPANQYDFVTVFMHELTHGLGFTSSLGPVPSGTNPTGVRNFNTPGTSMMVYDVRVSRQCAV